jgi:N6-adenosine-specific RNA methylase IME4
VVAVEPCLQREDRAAVKYRTIVADPPWEKPDTGARTHSLKGNWDTGPRKMAGIPSVTPYPQMTLEEIAALPISDLAEQDAHLYVWTFGPYIPEVYRLVEGWGFAASALLTGCKRPMGLGFGGAFVPTTEHVLFARRGRDVRLRRWDSTWFSFRRGEHSRKPDVLLDIVEQVSPAPRLELFARRQRLGWDTWGNEALQHVEMTA